MRYFLLFFSSLKIAGARALVFIVLKLVHMLYVKPVGTASNWIEVV